MIAKKIPNPKKSGSKSERAGGLVEYIREPELENGQEKCIHYECVNFMTDTLAAQKLEMIALSQEATRSKDPIDHWVLSFREGEKPTVEQAREAVSMLVEHCGLNGHLHVWGMHEDTGNVHIHIGINRVNPDTLKVTKINKGFDREAAQQAIALIEHKQGWQKERGARYDIDPTGKPIKREQQRDATPQPSTKARDMELQTGEKSHQRIAQEVAAPLIRDATSWKELHAKLAQVGMRFEREGSGAKVYVGVAPVGVKASDVDRKASFGQLQKRLGAYQPAREIEPHEYHSHTKKQDLATPRTPTGDGMRNLSECRLAELDASGQVKRAGVLHLATRLDRRRVDGLRREPGREAERHGSVDPQPRAPGQDGWNEYRQIRDERKAAKNADTLALKTRQEIERKQLGAGQKAERQQHLAGDWRGKGNLRNAMQSVLAAQHAAQKLEMAERQREERKALRERFAPLPMYRQWREQPRIVGGELRPQHVQQAEREKLSDVFKELSYSVDKRGHVTYRADGRDMFRDEGRSIAVLDSKSDRAIAAALATGQAKFGNTLTLVGSDAFKQQAVAAAVQNNLSVRFSDPALNLMRERMYDAKVKVEREQAQRLAVERATSEKAAADRAAAEKTRQQEQEQAQKIERGKTPGMSR